MLTPSRLWGREPAAIMAALGALIALAVGFGLDLTDEQVALIMAAAAAVLGLITRSQVTPWPRSSGIPSTPDPVVESGEWVAADDDVQPIVHPFDD